ncbi:UTP--glucose-1-phosphate uridylyltransferase 3, chloroplastic isoform X2 [Cynara cardunculus var. scolymus]|uniref:UTP--glucose-1-phosphate uridylyltransferase 3, chloroplastic isoform X2 n=1 Tax=Cynara cardunculus var. scolymus TaxID=59895 RepID=UPI000D62DF8A|nr:UTP--glucose-1-phosphate uridylyltransferase 3, chloroplastic isoform X2 [Cynara cardunculus var. scolymus]
MAPPTTSLLHHSGIYFTFSARESHSLFFNSHKSLRPSSNKLPLTSLSSQPSLPSGRRRTLVSTVPVEYVPPVPDFDFGNELARLRILRSRLSTSKSLRDKIHVVDSDAKVKRFFRRGHHKNGFARVLEKLKLDDYELFLLKCTVAAGQEHVLGPGYDTDSDFNGDFESARGSLKTALYTLVEIIEKWEGNDDREIHEEVDGVALRSLLKTLRDVEEFYDCIGGIIGYQLTILEILSQSVHGEKNINFQHINNSNSMGCQLLEIHPPSVLDLSQDTEYAAQAALWGIEGLPHLGEIYPLGGSADRLGLVDTVTGECLPAAMLPYCGRTLLEGLIRDLQAREFLYFKLYGEQCITPIAIMTSSAKNNHEHITLLCERSKWFGRDRSSFQLFEQPLVPAISAEDGQWLVKGQFVPVCKPGGHGVIWKLAYDKGIFQWFHDHRRKGATVRQVSNVVAATDMTLLALAGIGLHEGKKLGFASCKRNSGATEGINVLIEKGKPDGTWTYGVSCIEYTEFDKFGIADGSPSPNSLQTEFPANTNILYVDLSAAELIGSSKDETSLPGLVLNVKKSINYVDHFGVQHGVPGGRLECTMQNIADNFVNSFSSQCFEGVEEMLDTFIVYNHRRKVTSSAKKKRKPDDMSLHQTPDGALLDIIRNAYDLLSYCDITLPKIESNDKYAESGPPYLILLHPALGPLWEVTRQKIEVSEFLWRNVQLDGSLMIVAENVMGSQIDKNHESILQYGYRCARCKLENVKIRNKGIDWNSDKNLYWKHDVQRLEALKVVLHGNAEFEAVDVNLEGNHVFEVPDGYKMMVTSGNSGLSVHLNPIRKEFMDSGSWVWKYILKGKHIQLELVEF